ncbi:MAG: tripartite tricarboxylate transporter permease [Sporomusaceae bacterium]|nr:tripartite tricarboxylate transporter permease [Sporomusaceae bacterium]
MDIFQGLLGGFSIALSGTNMLFCFLGALLGTAVGVLPGLGPAATISLLLPVVYSMSSPATSIIFLAGIFYGAMYGGSTTSILLRIPGEAASVVTCIDGFQMAKKGRAGAALAIAAIGSFVAGTVGVIGLTFVAPPLAEFALRFGAPEYFALMLIGLLLAVFLSGDSPLKGLIMLFLGILLSNVGIDPISGKERFTFGIVSLQNGFEFVTLAMGLFGLSEVFLTLESKGAAEFVTATIGRIMPTARDWAESRWAILRGSFIGFFTGVIPGGGAVVASLTSYALEKKFAKHPEEFGQGAIAGVAGPESANNAASSASFIPLLTLGIPANASIAMIFAALLVQGVTPGPFLIQEHPDLFWGVIASMYLGNVILLVLNLPLVGLWVQLLKVPFGILGPLIVMFTVVGCYSLANDMFNVYVFIAFGVIGYILRKLRFDPGPLIMAFVLAPLIENSLRQSLLLSAGSMAIFVTRPISGTLMALFAAIVAAQAYKAVRKRKDVKCADNGE